jgi:hypothetical protein
MLTRNVLPAPRRFVLPVYIATLGVFANHQALANFICSVADFLRADFKQSEYGEVILPFTVLRRLD